MRLLLTASAAAAALMLAAPTLAQDMGPSSGDPYADQGYPGDDRYGADPNDPSAYGGMPPADDYGDQGGYPDAYPDQGYDPNGPNAMPPADDGSYGPPPPGYDDQPYDSGAGEPYDSAGPDDDGGAAAPVGDALGARENGVEARIHAAAASGRMNPDLANNALVELKSIRTQQAELMRRDGQLTDTTRGFIEDRLDVLEGRLEIMGGA